MPLRLAFMGTPEFAVPTLARLAQDGHSILTVYTQPPRPGGRRGLTTVKSPVHRQAELLGFPVRTPVDLKSREEQEAFCDLKADAAIVVAYGQLLPEAILKGAYHGCYNAHASLLPRWRGAAPIHRAIMAGDEETGVMVMKMDKGLDTGPVAMGETIAIEGDATTGDLHDRLMLAGSRLMSKAMSALEKDTLTLTPQAGHGVTYAAKIDKGETKIDFSRPARDVHNHIRGLSPFPGAWFEAQTGGRRERIKVLRSRIETGGGAAGRVLDGDLTVACGEGAIRLLRVQKAGGKAMDAADFLRGGQLAAGTVIG